MWYFLDTCICITYLRGKNEDVLRKIESYNPSQIKIPVIVLAELLHGAYKSQRTDENIRQIMDFLADFEIIPFEKDDAYTYGQIRSSLERKGLVIGDNDMLIAASALLRNATLVTNNIREFSRIDGLLLDDWTL